jgi:ParB family chromosome partitioning protein
MSSKKLFDADSFGGFWLDPIDDLVIIGLDEGGPEHPHYDPRVATMVPNQTLIDSIMTEGVLQPVEVLKDKETGKGIVIFGKNRVLNARIASKKRVDAGGERIMVMCIPPRRGSNQIDIMAGRLAENRGRRDSDPFTEAEEAAHFIKHNGDGKESIQRLCTVLGVTKARLNQLLKFREASEPVKKAAREAGAGMESVLQLLQMKEKDALKALDAIKTGGEKITTAKARNARRESTGKAALPGKRVLRTLIQNDGERRKEKGYSGLNDQSVALLRWIIGEGECPVKHAFK